VSVTYLIFHKNELVGHTDSEDCIKMYKEERKYKVKVKEVPTKELSEELINSDEFENLQLYQDDFLGWILNVNELIQMTEVMHERFGVIYEIVGKLATSMQYVKFDDDEKRLMAEFFKLFKMINDDLDENESQYVMEDYFNSDDIVDLVIFKK
jgi:hypothetical protein